MDPRASLGVILGLVTAFCLGLFMVPRRYFKGDSLNFLLGMTFGAALGGAVYWAVVGMPFKGWPFALCTLIPGVNWSLGTFAYAAGTHRVGLAKATGIKNTQVVLSVLGAFLIFKEGATTDPTLAVVGSALVVLTAIVLSRIRHSEQAVPHASPAGYLLPIIASILYGINGSLMKWLIDSGLEKPQINLGIGLGAFLGGAFLYTVRALYLFAKKRPGDIGWVGFRQFGLAAVGGLTWAVALVCMVVAIDFAGLAVAWSLLNLSIVVSVLYGVVILREIDPKRWRQVGFGLALACAGIVCLYLSKTVAAGG
ncbi:MAG: GRP family sugar transporter [Planctomycetota bacterium]